MKVRCDYPLSVLLPIILISVIPLEAQEANAGLDIRATVSGEAIFANELTESPRNGTPLDTAFRTVVYPTLKLSEHWTIASAVQFTSNPYFTEDYATPGHAVTFRVLRANIGYARFWKSGSINVHAGQLSSAVGSFNLRYDDAVNPLIDVPILYGYYGKISTMGLAGVQTDLTLGRWDARAQFVNSSLMDPRSLLQKDQYGNWAGGAGYTIRQGLRVGISGSRGPYLSREWPYFFPGESNPNTLPGSSAGAEVGFARGHWNIEGEWDWMLLPYHVMPFLRREGAYGEAKRVLSPRWYAAVREGYLYTNGDRQDVLELVAGYRPGVNELIKLGYELQHDATFGRMDGSVVVQLVTTVHPISLAWH
jgi:hypothetical protein